MLVVFLLVSLGAPLAVLICFSAILAMICTHLGLLNITEITGDFGARFCEEIPGIYCYTGEDCNCAFAGKGKVNPMKELEKNPKFQDSFA